MIVFPAVVKLPKSQHNQLFEAMKDAFRSRNALKLLTKLELDEDLDNIAPAAALPNDILNLMQWAEAEDRIEELVIGARSQNKTNQRLIAAERAIAPSDRARLPATEGFRPEKIVDDTKSMYDAIEWVDRMRTACAAVCRVDISGAAGGTGFLIADDLLMTNYHVLEPVLRGDIPASSVRFVFDFHKFASGAINKGVEYGLAAKNWKLDDSPDSAADGELEPQIQATKDELDFVIVRLEKKVGALPIKEGGPPRGFLKIPENEPILQKGESLHILQHPVGQHLKLALGENAILRPDNGAKTRLRYSTNTDRGSSGSPCFDKDWNLIALHHAGDPNHPKLKKAEYNQGIPIWTILQNSEPLRKELGR